MFFSVILFPIAITFYITWWFIHFVDGFFSPIYAQLGINIFGKYISYSATHCFDYHCFHWYIAETRDLVHFLSSEKPHRHKVLSKNLPNFSIPVSFVFFVWEQPLTLSDLTSFKLECDFYVFLEGKKNA